MGRFSDRCGTGAVTMKHDGKPEGDAAARLDQCLFELTSGDWDAFWHVLEEPPYPSEALKALMAERPPWPET